MQLLILFLKQVDKLNELLKVLAQNGVKGGTIVDARGMGESLAEMEDIPVFGFLRQYTNLDHNENTKLLMMAIKDDEVVRTANLIKGVIGDLNKPNSAVLITLPIMYCEGIADQK